MKTDLPLREYRSIGMALSCPACGSNNTFYSCKYCQWACHECGELFDRVQQGIVIPSRKAMTSIYSQPPIIPIPSHGDFDRMRELLRRTHK